MAQHLEKLISLVPKPKKKSHCYCVTEWQKQERARKMRKNEHLCYIPRNNEPFHDYISVPLHNKYSCYRKGRIRGLRLLKNLEKEIQNVKKMKD